MRYLLLSIGLLALCKFASTGEVQDINKLDWWKKTNLYHIYIRSFKDSDGNGEGDIRGITSKLDYIKSIGVETLLLSPFYSSPMKDGGYDIDDYLATNEKFGSMQDFEDLVAGLKARSMRIVVDFVPNHSSNKHKWFQCSERALIDPECAKYKDYYVWSASRRFNNTYPTNWRSLFGGGSAWEWSPVRQEYYLHQFLPEQPDLNLRNPLVRDEFKEIARFWLRKGVDGLRVDAVLHFLEDTIEWRDEPPNPKYVQSVHSDPYDALLHIYTRSLPESATIVEDWHKVAREEEFGGNPVIITEAYDTIQVLLEYYGPNPSKRYADMPFNFELFALGAHMTADPKTWAPPEAAQLNPINVSRIVTSWISATLKMGWPHEGGAISPWSCWVTGNHDNSRAVNRVGRLNVDIFRWLAFLSPGVPVSYYGDEINLENTDFNKIPTRTLKEGEPTRLAFRAPMAWTANEPAGDFSTNGDIWMPLNDNWRTNNVANLMGTEGKSSLKNFIQLQKIRKSRAELLAFGDLTFFANKPISVSLVFAMARHHEKFGNLLVLANFDTNYNESVHLIGGKSVIEAVEREPPTRAKVLLLNYETKELAEGSEVELKGLALGPSQAAIMEF